MLNVTPSDESAEMTAKSVHFYVFLNGTDQIIISHSKKIKITADTVHGFQGDQCDIVFCLVTPNGHRYSGDLRSLVSKDYIYNVAISRAENYLNVIHPFEDIQNNIHINSIFNIANKKNEEKYRSLMRQMLKKYCLVIISLLIKDLTRGT